MKYFTKEELEDITKELMENPTRETLQKLNNKYNGGSEEVTKILTTEKVEPPVLEPIPTVVEDPVVNPIENQVPNMEIPKVDDNLINNINQVPSVELPQLETQTFNNPNNTPVNFSGNLWETPTQEASNLMQTTDNFNSIPSTMPTTEVPVTGVPFFGPNQQPVNNPIPVNDTPVQGPSMFGQIEQNYM